MSQATDDGICFSSIHHPPTSSCFDRHGAMTECVREGWCTTVALPRRLQFQEWKDDRLGRPRVRPSKALRAPAGRPNDRVPKDVSSVTSRIAAFHERFGTPDSSVHDVGACLEGRDPCRSSPFTNPPSPNFGRSVARGKARPATTLAGTNEQ